MPVMDRPESPGLGDDGNNDGGGGGFARNVAEIPLSDLECFRS